MGGGSSITSADKALQVACKAGDLEAAKKAIKDGADINAASPEPPLILAAWWGQHTIVKYFFDECKEDGACENLDKGVRSAKVTGGSVMHACCGRNHLEVFKVLTERGSDQRELIYHMDDNRDDGYMIAGKYMERKMSSSKDVTSPIKEAFLSFRGKTNQ